MDNRETFTILVVDDDPAIRRFLEKRLLSWDYRVVTEESGNRAITNIEAHPPDIVLTGLFMSDGDGFGLLDHIKKTLPQLPVVILSGKGERGDVIQALRLGAWDYLYKPIDEASFLRKAIERVLEKARRLKENQTYRKHLEAMVWQKNAQLQASEKRYRTVANFTYNWEYWVAPDGEIVYISPSCERIVGYSMDAFVQNPSLLQDIIHPEDRGTFSRHLEASHSQKKIFSMGLRITRRDGEERWIGHNCQPVFDEAGNFLGRRCSNRDITYQKEIERDLIRQRQALLDKTFSQEKTNEALKALLDQREIEKRAIEQTMVTNLKRYVFPYLDDMEHLKNGDDVKDYIKIIRTNIEQLISPVSRSLTGAYQGLTPREIKVADFIRQGRSTKSIADMLAISPSTVEKHRNGIRNKLNILKQKVNLYTFLTSLD
ncbi:MAG: response regulator [Desulfobacterales bacterium]|nr:response regulator [Desulfobacterales bacterium]